MTGISIGGVRATTSKSAGDFYFEAIPTVALSAGGAIGVANSAATLNNYLGSDANGYGIFPNGNVLYNGAVVAVVSPYMLGSVIGIAVAASAQLMWERRWHWAVERQSKRQSDNAYGRYIGGGHKRLFPHGIGVGELNGNDYPMGRRRGPGFLDSGAGRLRSDSRTFSGWICERSGKRSN